MKLLTKLNPETCPQAIAEITRRCTEAKRANTVFLGHFYEIEGANVWFACADWAETPPFENKWADADFGFAPAPVSPAPSVKENISNQQIEQEILGHYNSSVLHRARVELKICRRLLSDLWKDGYSLRIFDGGETTPVTEEMEALRLLFNLDDATTQTRKEGQSSSFVYLVFGNDGFDVISEYGVSLEEPFMEKFNKWVDSL